MNGIHDLIQSQQATEHSRQQFKKKEFQKFLDEYFTSTIFKIIEKSAAAFNHSLLQMLMAHYTWDSRLPYIRTRSTSDMNNTKRQQKSYIYIGVKWKMAIQLYSKINYTSRKFLPNMTLSSTEVQCAFKRMYWMCTTKLPTLRGNFTSFQTMSYKSHGRK